MRTEFTSKLKEALKSKDAVALSTIRLIMAALKDRDISARGQGKAEGVEDSEILSMLSTMIKQRRESAKIYMEAGREELAEREDAEVVVIQGFMPAQLDDAQVDEIIDGLISELGASEIKDMGKIMGALKGRYAGQLDMGKVGGLVKSKLG